MNAMTELEIEVEEACDDVACDDVVCGEGSCDDDSCSTGKIYCANCIHCKVIPSSPDRDDRYFLRVRCAAGKWRKKLGEEKVYKYCTVARRSISACDKYEDMGEASDYIRDLKKTLPVKDELYVF